MQYLLEDRSGHEGNPPTVGILDRHAAVHRPERILGLHGIVVVMCWRLSLATVVVRGEFEVIVRAWQAKHHARVASMVLEAVQLLETEARKNSSVRVLSSAVTDAEDTLQSSHAPTTASAALTSGRPPRPRARAAGWMPPRRPRHSLSAGGAVEVRGCDGDARRAPLTTRLGWSSVSCHPGPRRRRVSAI
jgi:hypothetical protein